MLKTGDDRFYQKYSEYRDALTSQPHIVIIQFGTNDVMHPQWSESAFVSEYVTFIERFMDLDTCPSIYLIIPEPSYDDTEDDTAADIVSRRLVKQRINHILPDLIREIGSVTNAVLIDGFSVMGGSGFTRLDAYGPDFLHLNDLGYIGVAHAVAELLATHERFYFITQKMQLSIA